MRSATRRRLLWGFTSTGALALVAALADAASSDADELAAMPSLLFDWEIRSGTTERLQDAMIEIGAVGYERPLPEDELVDRTLALDALGLPAR